MKKGFLNCIITVVVVSMLSQGVVAFANVDVEDSNTSVSNEEQTIDNKENVDCNNNVDDKESIDSNTDVESESSGNDDSIEESNTECNDNLRDKGIDTTKEEINDIIDKVKETEVSITDANLDSAIRKSLGISVDTKITIELLGTIEELDISNLSVSGILELKYCINLEKINISDSTICNLDILSLLPKLKSITARRCGIKDVRIFAAIKSLEYLDIGENRISDISPLYENIKSGNLKYLNAGDQVINMGTYVTQKSDYIDIPLSLKGIDGKYVDITSMVNYATYIKEKMVLRFNYKDNQEVDSLECSFNDLAQFDGKEYSFNGIINQDLSLLDKSNNTIKANTSSLKDNGVNSTVKTSTNKTATKSTAAKSQKTGDVGVIGTLGMAVASLASVIITKRKK